MSWLRKHKADISVTTHPADDLRNAVVLATAEDVVHDLKAATAQLQTLADRLLARLPPDEDAT